MPRGQANNIAGLGKRAGVSPSSRMRSATAPLWDAEAMGYWDACANFVVHMWFTHTAASCAGFEQSAIAHSTQSSL